MRFQARHLPILYPKPRHHIVPDWAAELGDRIENPTSFPGRLMMHLAFNDLQLQKLHRSLTPAIQSLSMRNLFFRSFNPRCDSSLLTAACAFTTRLLFNSSPPTSALYSTSPSAALPQPWFSTSSAFSRSIFPKRSCRRLHSPLNTHGSRRYCSYRRNMCKLHRDTEEAGGSLDIAKGREVLPKNVKPIHYDLTLEPNFQTFKYDGKVDIE